MLTADDFKQIDELLTKNVTKIVTKIVRKEIGMLERRINRKLDIIIDSFDTEYLGLRTRVDRLERKVFPSL
jgi:polyhydroxyalkanoate synthesis regulator phasin